ncbi:hypothetical protein [Leucobacter ruminantium]|uniref:Enolase n=1 Tax=Leucobacter ruminantium TaxID=1289170 RepID=A0A939RZC0_9MICO|nr:hypothetical protein [Leucobacter ruminantium]MBO1806573.1 hypothetical protein [Leucobacter ruminantium]
MSSAAGAHPLEDRDPEEGEAIIVGDPRVRAFPDPAAVFASDQPWLERLLHPLVSIELSAFNSAWNGRVPLLSPVEPEEGLLGENTAAHHDDYACENWISFRLDDKSRVAFLGQRRFFEIEDLEAAGRPRAVELSESYAEAAAEFAATRTRFARLGVLTWADKQDPTRPREGWGFDDVLVDALGGEPGYGNWAEYPPPAAFTLDDSDPATPVLRLADGRPFTYVAATSGYPWRSHGADAILVFFEPETRTVVFTFDWS